MSKLPPIDWDAIKLKKGVDWDLMCLRIGFALFIPITLPWTLYDYFKQKRIWNNRICPANGIEWTQITSEARTVFGSAWFEAGEHEYWFDFPSLTGVLSDFYFIPRKVEYPPPRVIPHPPQPHRNTL